MLDPGKPLLEPPFRGVVIFHHGWLMDAPPGGLEPPACGLGSRRSILLSYEGAHIHGLSIQEPAGTENKRRRFLFRIGRVFEKSYGLGKRYANPLMYRFPRNQLMRRNVLPYSCCKSPYTASPLPWAHRFVVRPKKSFKGQYLGVFKKHRVREILKLTTCKGGVGQTKATLVVDT